ncbi:MAG: phosphoenolpyruvate--protein phosphotransferase [Oscillospiraceae bacterium]
MRTMLGTSVSDGIAIGAIKVYKPTVKSIRRRKVEEASAEVERFKNAKNAAICELNELYSETLKDIGTENAEIFNIHTMMLNDKSFTDEIEKTILTQHINAEFAVATVSENFRKIFTGMSDSYMQGRATDVTDISERLISILTCKINDFVMDTPSIIVASEITPSEAMSFDTKNLLGIVTIHGSKYSHTAIIARTLNIPAIIGCDCDLESILNGEFSILDGDSGKIIIDPDSETIKAYNAYCAEKQKALSDLELLKGLETTTKSGRSISLLANINNLGDIPAAISNDAKGVGLFRSEFIYLNSKNYPMEEEQFEIYKTVAKKMNGRRVIIRTMDIGADKKIEYFNLPPEENPAMGYRAIRICLKRRELFETQLRAIYRASKFGKVSIMFPMIVSVSEVRQIKHIIDVVKTELRGGGYEYSDDVEIGIMIETPAAAIISDELAKEVDFFSIGTNDLTQYTLACDRQNPNLSEVYDSHHSAILKLIKIVTENAHKNGIWSGICGDLATDFELTETFIKMGVDELSVPSTFILPLRKIIREMK